MSRLGKKPVQVPAGAKVNIAGRTISVEGPKGSLSFEFRPEVDVSYDEGGKVVTVTVDEKLIARTAPTARTGEPPARSSTT